MRGGAEAGRGAIAADATGRSRKVLAAPSVLLARSHCLLALCVLHSALRTTCLRGSRDWPHVCGLGKVSELCSNVMLECDALVCRRRRGAKDDRTRKDDSTVMLCRQDGPCRQDACRGLGRAHSCLEPGHVKAYRGPASKHPPPLAQPPPPSSAVPTRVWMRHFPDELGRSVGTKKRKSRADRRKHVGNCPNYSDRKFWPRYPNLNTSVWQTPPPPLLFTPPPPLLWRRKKRSVTGDRSTQHSRRA